MMSDCTTSIEKKTKMDLLKTYTSPRTGRFSRLNWNSFTLFFCFKNTQYFFLPSRLHNFFSFVRFLRFVFVFHLVCMQLCDLRSTNFNSYTCNVVNRTNSFDSFYANTHFYNERKKWTKKILLAFFFHCIFVCHGWLTLCLGSFTSLYLFER